MAAHSRKGRARTSPVQGPAHGRQQEQDQKGHAQQDDAGHFSSGRPFPLDHHRHRRRSLLWRLLGRGLLIGRLPVQNQLVQGDAEELAELHQFVQVRHAAAGFPLADGLTGYAQSLRQVPLG